MNVRNPVRFFSDWPSRIRGCPLSDARRESLTLLLLLLDRSPEIPTRQLAYILATIRHETAGTFRPLKEFRAKPGTRTYTLQQRYWPSGYFGRGYVQLTWERNYAQLTERLRRMGVLTPADSLVTTPDLACDPWVAWHVLIVGMQEGLFTGKRLGDYIDQQRTDYVNARRVVNGIDQAERIAGYANEFELLLRAAGLPTALPEVRHG